MRDDGHSLAVSVTLLDPEPYDFFAVKIEMDPAYGTPVFTTMGGMSSCPGETGTTKVDSAVTIFKVEYHCDPVSFAVTNECFDLVSGATASVGVILQNMSPTRGAVTMRLMAGTSDSWYDGMRVRGAMSTDLG